MVWYYAAKVEASPILGRRTPGRSKRSVTSIPDAKPMKPMRQNGAKAKNALALVFRAPSMGAVLEMQSPRDQAIESEASATA